MTPIIFNTRDELIKVDIDKMIYAMAEDNYVHMYFRNGQSVMVCMTLQSLEQLILSVIVKNKKGVYKSNESEEENDERESVTTPVDNIQYIEQN